MSDEFDEDKSTNEKISETMAARIGNYNLSYYAFTATPKIKRYSYLDVCPIQVYHHLKPINLKLIMSIQCAKQLRKALFWMS